MENLIPCLRSDSDQRAVEGRRRREQQRDGGADGEDQAGAGRNLWCHRRPAAQRQGTVGPGDGL